MSKRITTCFFPFITVVLLFSCRKQNSEVNVNVKNDPIPDTLAWKLNNQPLLNNGVNIRCKVGDSDSMFLYCDCYLEEKSSGNTISEGVYYVDTLNKNIFRSGWHKNYNKDLKLIEKVHYSVLSLDNNGRNESINENIRFNETGDTLFDKSSYFDFDRKDTLKLGEPYSIKIQFKLLEEWNTIHYEMQVIDVPESMDSAITKKYNFSYQFTPKQQGKYRFQGYFFFVRPLEDKKNAVINSRYVIDDFYVVK